MKYLKAFAGAAVAALGVLVVGLDDGALAAEEIAAVFGAFGASFGLVWAIPNSVLIYAKAIASGLAAGLTALLAGLDDGALTGNEWYAVVFALVGGLTTYAVPNRQP